VFALGDTPTVGTAATNNGDRADVLQAGRYHSLALEFTGYTEVVAVKPTLVPESEE
jgi:hypothetical protein